MHDLTSNANTNVGHPTVAFPEADTVNDGDPIVALSCTVAPPPPAAEEIDMVHTLLLMREKCDANAELLPGLDGIENGIENGIGVGKVILEGM